MGGLLGNPLGFNRILTSSDDLNDIKDGIYSYLNNNNPANSYAGTNTLIIQMSVYGRNDKWQFALCSNNRSIAVRINYAGNWGSWADLNTGL